MKADVKNFIFAPFLILAGFAILFLFQNCSEDVAFDSRPSAVLPDPVGGDVINPNGVGVGGTADLIVRFNETPKDQTTGQGNPVVDFEVISPVGNVTDVVCTVNGQVVDCDPKDRVTIPITGPGQQTFTIQATNSNNQTVTETITFNVFDRIVARTKAIAVTTFSDKVDIIINVDNSGSMEYEQRSMAERIANFMDKFKDLDYHISVTTTSPIGSESTWRASLNYVDGKFVPLSNGSYCIKKSDNLSVAQAQQILGASVQRDLYLRDANGNPVINQRTGNAYPEGNGWERGIFTTRRSFERSQANGSPESGCLRSGVAKHVVLISDERETLVDENGVSLALQGVPQSDLAKSDGQNLINYVASIHPNTIFKFHSIIVNPYTEEGQACLASHGARPGVEYGALSVATGGEIGSVCAADYSAQLERIGQSVSDSKKSYQLDCNPVANNGNMGNVTSGGQPIAMAYQFVGNKVEFADLLPAGNYVVNYFCFQ